LFYLHKHTYIEKETPFELFVWILESEMWNERGGGVTAAAFDDAYRGVDCAAS